MSNLNKMSLTLILLLQALTTCLRPIGVGYRQILMSRYYQSATGPHFQLCPIEGPVHGYNHGPAGAMSMVMYVPIALQGV